MMGNCLGGMVDACGPTHAAVAAEIFRARHAKGGDWNTWPDDLRVREMPGAK